MTSSFRQSTSFALTACALALALPSISAYAGNTCDGCTTPILTGQTTSAGGGKREALRVYAGVNWVFGTQPELVLGVRSTRTDSHHKVQGAKFEASFPISMNSIAFDKLRLRALGGHRTAMAEAGVGYSFLAKSYLLSGAVQGNYVIMGTDYAFTAVKSWQPFLGLNTLYRPDAPTGMTSSGGSLACSGQNEQLVLVSDLGGLTTPNQLNNYTCVVPF